LERPNWTAKRPQIGRHPVDMAAVPPTDPEAARSNVVLITSSPDCVAIHPWQSKAGLGSLSARTSNPLQYSTGPRSDRWAFSTTASEASRADRHTAEQVERWRDNKQLHSANDSSRHSPNARRTEFRNPCDGSSSPTARKMSPDGPNWVQAPATPITARKEKFCLLEDVEESYKQSPYPGHVYHGHQNKTAHVDFVHAGYPSSGSLPTRGKKTHIYHEGTGTVFNSSIPSMRSPDWFKQSFEQSCEHHEDKGQQVTQHGTARKPQWQRNPAVDEETGKVLSNSIVSGQSPNFMKSPFESNKDFFIKQGIAQNLKKREPDTARAAGKEQNVAVQQGTNRQGRKTQIVQETGRICNQTIVSVESPNFFKGPFENNKAFFMDQGIVEKMKSLQDLKGSHNHSAGYDVTKQVNGKRVNIASPETGKVYATHMVSVGEVPEVMKRNYENHKDHYEKIGQKPTGKAHDERSWDYAGTDSQFVHRHKTKTTCIVAEESGKVHAKNIVSPESPSWMKEPFENNREHFVQAASEGKHPVQKLGPSAQKDLQRRLDYTCGKSVGPRQIHISHTASGDRCLGEKYCISNGAPDWFKSPVLNGFGQPTQSTDDVDPYAFQAGLRDPQGHDKAWGTSRRSTSSSGFRRPQRSKSTSKAIKSRPQKGTGKMRRSSSSAATSKA